MFPHKTNLHHSVKGILFVGLFALISYYAATLTWVANKGFSPLVIAIVLGMIFGSTLRHHLPQEWTPGIRFVAKRILRVAIIFFGFRLTFQQVAEVGVAGFIIDVVIVGLTLTLGTYIGVKLLKLDRDTSLLISSGAAICGAAAVLATEGVLKSEPHKAAVAVISVVIFGTIAMFLYPFLQHAGWLSFDNQQYAIYAGATIHEVAQVLVAGSAIDAQTGNSAVIVKMTRVLLLAPTLIILGIWITRSTAQKIQHKISENIPYRTNEKIPYKMAENIPYKISDTIPWFAILFIVVVSFNSLHILSSTTINIINQIDTFLLTLAMAALGIETNLTKIKHIGLKPLYLSLFLFAWLLCGGYILCKFMFYI